MESSTNCQRSKSGSIYSKESTSRDHFPRAADRKHIERKHTLGAEDERYIKELASVDPNIEKPTNKGIITAVNSLYNDEDKFSSTTLYQRIKSLNCTQHKTNYEDPRKWTVSNATYYEDFLRTVQLEASEDIRYSYCFLDEARITETGMF